MSVKEEMMTPVSDASISISNNVSPYKYLVLITTQDQVWTAAKDHVENVRQLVCFYVNK